MRSRTAQTRRLTNTFHALVELPCHLRKLIDISNAHRDARICPIGPGKFELIVGSDQPHKHADILPAYHHKKLESQQSAGGLTFRSRSSVAFKSISPP